MRHVQGKPGNYASLTCEEQIFHKQKMTLKKHDFKLKDLC